MEHLRLALFSGGSAPRLPGQWPTGSRGPAPPGRRRLRSSAGSGPRPPGRRDVLIGWAEAAEAAAAAAARGDREHSPAGAAEAPGARRKWSRGARLGRARGSRGPAGGRAAAASVAMCAQVWLLTDRLIREDYPQVQILRALRQRCSEQDVGFRAVFLDQIAVTVVGGHLGELCPGREGGGKGGREGRWGPVSQRLSSLSPVPRYHLFAAP